MMDAFDDINEKFDDWNSNVRNNEKLTKEQKEEKFWDMAVELFNEHIAGDVTTVTGKVIHTPRIERS